MENCIAIDASKLLFSSGAHTLLASRGFGVTALSFQNFQAVQRSQGLDSITACFALPLSLTDLSIKNLICTDFERRFLFSRKLEHTLLAYQAWSAADASRDFASSNRSAEAFRVLSILVIYHRTNLGPSAWWSWYATLALPNVDYVCCA